MICQNCGQTNPEDCLFCVYCGTRIEEDDDKTIYAKPEVKLKEKTPEPSLEDNKNEPSEPIPDVKLKEKATPPPPPPDNSFSDKKYEDNSSSKSSYNPPPIDGKANSFATISFIIGIVCVITCCATGLGGWLCFAPHALCGLLGIVLGIMGKMQVSKSNGMQTGSGYATAGIVISSLLLLGSLLYLIVLTFTGFAMITLPAIFQDANW